MTHRELMEGIATEVACRAGAHARAEDGKWVTGRDCKFGVWTTENLIDVKRLSAQTLAELMGGEGNE